MDLLTLLDYKLKIAVLEDDPIILEDIRMMLISLGHVVVATYTSGEALLEEFSSMKYDLVVVDIELEGEKSGIDVAFEIQTMRNLPLIYLTSYSDETTVKKILKTDPYGFILKPARKEQLSIAINIAYYKFISDKRIRENERRYQSIVEALPLLLARINPIDESITFTNKNFSQFMERNNFKKRDTFFEFMESAGFPGVFDLFLNLTMDNNSIQKEYLIRDGDLLCYYKVVCQALYDDQGLLFEYQALCEDITEQREHEQKIKNYSYELDKRIKELKCLYSISGFLESTKYINKILQRIVDEVALALNNLQSISCFIEYGDESYYSYNYFKSNNVYEHPIVVRGSVVGQIYLNIAEGLNISENFSNGELDLVSTVAELISKSVEKIEAELQLKKLEKEIIMTSEREKQKLGHELHDGIGQILTGTSLILKSLEKKLTIQGEVPQELFDVVDLVKDATVKCRRLSKGLVPVSYSNETFIYLLEQLMHSTQQLYGLNFEINIPENFDLKTSFATSQLYRIVQEAVNNTVKHAYATKVVVQLEVDVDSVRFSISDNGGATTDKIKDPGLGMNIMKYRSDLIGADFDVIMKSEEGTAVIVRLPHDLVKL